MKTQEIKRNKKFYQWSKQFKGRCNHCGKYGHKKTDCWELHGKPNTESKQEGKELGAKVNGKYDISKVKCYNCNHLGHFAKDCPFPEKKIKKEEDQYPPNAFAMMCMDEEKDNAKTAEVKESEERKEQSEEGEQHNVQEGAQVPITFEEMLSRREEQTESAHDPIKIKFETWDVTMRCVTHDMEPNMDRDEELQRTSRDIKEDEEQGRRHHETNMSMYQVDPKFQTHMASHAPTEMKIQDHQDDDEEGVPINQDMDNQPSSGKRKHDEEDDR